MSDEVVANRYADALFDLGNEKNTLDQYVEELITVKEVFSDNEQLDTFLKHPSVKNSTKKQMLEEAFNGLHVDIVNTLKLLVERDRTEMVIRMIDHFIQLVNDKNGIAEAKVFSVRELSKPEQEELQATFARRFNKQGIHLVNIVDPHLLGGMKVQVGNTIFDGTVKNKLRRIERNIVAANN